MEWWYIKDGQQYGPDSTDKIQGLLYSGALPSSARVWTQGFDSWKTASEVDPLSEVFKLDKPSPSTDGGMTFVRRRLTAAITPNVPTAWNLWARYFARQFDLLLFGTLGGVVLLILFPQIFTHGVLENDAVAGLVLVPIALLIEIPILALTGSTLGKWLFGISLRRADGSRLSLSELLTRNFSLWVYGLGLGIPIVSLFTMVGGYKDAKGGQRNKWDRVRQNNISYKKVATLRHGLAVAALIFAIPVFIIAAVQLVGTNLATTFETVQSVKDVTTKKAAVWRNPLTGSVATLFAGWNPVPDKDDPSTFEFQNGHSVVVLGRETLDNSDLGTYLDLLQKNVSYGLLSDKKMQYDGNSGISYYILNYVNAADPSTPANVDVKVWQTTPSSYWRTVVIAPLSEEQHRAEAQALADRLEKTSLDEQ